MCAICQYLLFALVLGNVRSAKGKVGSLLCQRFDPLVKAQLHIGTSHHRLVPAPVAALHTGKHLESHSLDGCEVGTCSQQRVVDTQRALLIVAQDEARTKLLIEGT